VNHEPGALDGIRIVDLTQHVAGPYCTMLLAGMGADVVKVEPPSGEAGRQVAPFVHDHRDIEASLRFLHLNRAKRSVVLDATSQDGRLALRELTAGADVLILDEAPARALALWGMDEDELRSDRPTLTLVSLPPFASGTPWSDWLGSELILAAVSGSASCTGEADRLPLESGGYLSLVAQGQTAAVATLAALLAVRRGGAGTYVEVAGSEANAEMLAQWTGGRHQRMPRMGRIHQTNYPWQCYRAKDGWVGVQSGPGTWRDFCALIGAPELSEYEPREARLRARERIDAAIERWLSNMGKIEAYHAGQAARFGFGYVATVEDLAKSPQLQARGFFRQIDHPAAPNATYGGPPFSLASGWRDARAPLLGEHTEEVLAALASARAIHLPDAGVSRFDATQPLEGVRVLDLTQIWAGPRAVMTLSDYGAEVIKIESLARAGGRLSAAGSEIGERALNRRSGYENLHRGKKHVTLDLGSELGAKAFRQLVDVSDVVVANFAAGVLSRLVGSFEDLQAINPRLIVVSMTGFGDSGPESDYVAYGVAQEQLCGIYSITGYEGGEPLKSGFNVGDPMNGMHGAAAVIAALIERERTGRGQYIDLSQFESSVPFVGDVLLDFFVNGRVARPVGNSDPTWAPHGIYPARGDDEWVAIVTRDDEEWRRTLDVLGASELAADPRFRDLGGRVVNHAQLDDELASRTERWDRDELAEALQTVGVPAAPVLHTDEIWEHPQFVESGFVQRLSHPDGGEYSYLGPMWRINGRRPRVRGPAPLLGEHNDEVLGALTRLSEEEIAALGR
jgi:crotonobetainyl-CoA:carnitine CoA-transferase CaiB-like acyl-CoA transferase